MGFSLHISLLCYMLQTFLLIISCLFVFSAAIDTIKANESLRDSESLISNGNGFNLSFFSPPNSSYRYVGIMFNLPVMTVVWVANRNKPLNDSTGTLELSSDGNLVIMDGRKEIVWSTNLSTSVANSSVVLLDTGNLVLQDNFSNTYWESFEHASDSWLDKMRIVTDLSRDERNTLTSWRSGDDPALGSFTLSIEPLDIPQSFILKDGYPYLRTGPWNGQIFTGLPHMESDFNVGANVVLDSPGNAYMVFTRSSSDLTYFILNSSGDLVLKLWSDEEKAWGVAWSLFRSECDMYSKCGPFGNCNAQKMPSCSCFHGFIPNNKDEWEVGNWTRGCTRGAPLQCEQNSSMGKPDEFVQVKRVKMPDHYKWLPSSEGDCRSSCLSNCSCIAYANPSGIGCLQWTGSLTDAQEFSYGGEDLYLRLAFSELANKKHNRSIIIATTVVSGIILVAVCGILLYYRARKHRNRLIIAKSKGNEAGYSEERKLKQDKHEVKLEEIPLFKFEELSNATENFDSVNKLGQGGFGAVYKGHLPNGQEIAVKRLARSSNQGAEEFKNEVEVISRLQHRNLVRLLGCCVESEEKMVVYEYMPNGSLDTYLIYSNERPRCDWETRKFIVEGICRGLLYLHRDSRLKIIHRDLKASNILLDEELNPKISDFGMARIFGGKSDQANTNRVVGTYGYMSPEYALQGIFSEKSDVYSFGVLLLEIVSGKKNSRFYDEDQDLFLIAYVWKLWNDGKIVSLMDPAIYNAGMEGDVVRYANVGLLCVQEAASDRPNISTVLSMLSSEIVELPRPNEPAFLKMQMSPNTATFTKSSSDGSMRE